MIGIYSIYSKSQRKHYIGESINIQARWRKHLSDLKLNKHHSKYLQNVYNKYGEQDLIFSVIEECSKEDRFEKEKSYIQKYNSFQDGFNETTGGDYGAPNRKFSEETLRKLSERMKGVNNPCYDKWGDLNPNNKITKQTAIYIYFYTHSNFDFPKLQDNVFYGKFNITKDIFGKIKRDITWKKLAQEVDLESKDLFLETLNFIKAILSQAEKSEGSTTIENNLAGARVE